MEVVVIHENSASAKGGGLLRFACAGNPIAELTFEGLCAGRSEKGDDSDIVIAVPQQWCDKIAHEHPAVTHYNGNLPIRTGHPKKPSAGWLIVSNGRFSTNINREMLCRKLTERNADVVAVNVDPALLSCHEKVRITSEGNVAGFRRLYSDSMLPVPFPDDWPCHLFISLDAVNRIAVNSALPLSFAELIDRCRSMALNCHSLSTAGHITDLETTEGLLEMLTQRIRARRFSDNPKARENALSSDASRHAIPASTRLFGEVVLGDGVRIGDNALIVGPALISDNVRIGNGAVVRASVIGPGLSIPEDSLVQNHFLIGPDARNNLPSHTTNAKLRQPGPAKSSFTADGAKESNFRIWPKFSYPRFGKRIVDITGSILILILFAPVFPIIAIAVKLTSAGPVFYKAKRQGLHGKEFDCLKFRSMMASADAMQEKLRVANQVDGPQFKMEDDPRITIVGKFLRNTYLDEIPQFVNVLLGEMSVVGPRPSPDEENSLCPVWRDARLSVRPGITGLWQVCRTRLPGQDFQEWIYYDTRYIRELSLCSDVLVAWRTATKLISNFIDQF